MLHFYATAQLTSMVIGILLAIIILWLVRRDHLHGPYALWWIGVAICVTLLGLFPGIIDFIAQYLGINYPPMLAVILACALLLVKILILDLTYSRQERQIRRLAQQLAMLEAHPPLLKINLQETDAPSSYSDYSDR